MAEQPIYTVPHLFLYTSMSAILLERLLYRRAGIVAPIRTYLTARPGAGTDNEVDHEVNKDIDPSSSKPE